MYYFVTVATAVGRQLNHIRAKDRDEARHTVAEYNTRHPDWKMRLLKRKPTNRQSKLETKLFRKSGADWWRARNYLVKIRKVKGSWKHYRHKIGK